MKQQEGKFYRQFLFREIPAKYVTIDMKNAAK